VRADSPMVDFARASPNVGPRRDGLSPRLLIMHYTGMASAGAAIDLLCDPTSGVSCHYVVDIDGGIAQLVAEDMRAWHAGMSYWQGTSDINSASIGIEIQNLGHDRGYPDFPPAQMQAVARLARDICRRHGIAAEGVLAHSDVAPDRKIDPGEKFDWRWLAREGVGRWLDPATLDPADAGLDIGTEGAEIAAVQAGLAAIGYGLPVDGTLGAETKAAIRAFQLHFRPARPDGRLDRATLATIARHVRALPPAVGAQG
jgi:N-acetylmuramoyl-L-alanine amidase